MRLRRAPKVCPYWPDGKHGKVQLRRQWGFLWLRKKVVYVCPSCNAYYDDAQLGCQLASCTKVPELDRAAVASYQPRGSGLKFGFRISMQCDDCALIERSYLFGRDESEPAATLNILADGWEHVHKGHAQIVMAYPLEQSGADVTELVDWLTRVIW